MQRSSREQKDCIGDSHNNIAKVKIFDTVTEIFKDRIDSDVIRLILEESEWKGIPYVLFLPHNFKVEFVCERVHVVIKTHYYS